MIENIHQYKITRDAAAGFRDAITLIGNSPIRPGEDPRLFKASIEGMQSQLDDLRAEMTTFEWPLAKAIHEAKIALCWGKSWVGRREPWPEKRPGEFGYVPQPHSDIAMAQAAAALAALVEGTP